MHEKAYGKCDTETFSRSAVLRVHPGLVSSILESSFVFGFGGGFVTPYSLNQPTKRERGKKSTTEWLKLLWTEQITLYKSINIPSFDFLDNNLVSKGSFDYYPSSTNFLVLHQIQDKLLFETITIFLTSCTLSWKHKAQENEIQWLSSGQLFLSVNICSVYMQYRYTFSHVPGVVCIFHSVTITFSFCSCRRAISVFFPAREKLILSLNTDPCQQQQMTRYQRHLNT